MSTGQSGRRVVVAITSPLEPEHAATIAAVDPDRIDLRYLPELMPPTRYTADHNGVAGWKRTEPDETRFRAAIRDAEVTWDVPIAPDAGPLDLCPGLRWIQTSSAGVGQRIKQLGLADTNLIVTTSSGVHARPLAEFVFAVLLHHAKCFSQLRAWQNDHHWQRYCGGELDGQTIAIIGPGRIGRQIALVARAFGMNTWALARTHDPARAETLGVDRLFTRDELRAMLAGADAVVLCMPHTPETEDMIGAAEIAAMKPGTVLVNIARGAVIDEDAMVVALRSGQIAFAGLDVFRQEPLPPDSPIWDLPNVIVNPHSASTAASENRKIVELFAHNLRCYLDHNFAAMSPVLDKTRLY